MKADPEVQLRLLDLQARDAALARLEHRRRTLPELAVIADADTRLAALRDDVVRAETEVGDLDRERAGWRTTSTRSARARSGTSSGCRPAAVPAKELESLQHEVETLARRQSDLEDTELEVMERREDAEARAGEVRPSVEQVTATRSEAEQASATRRSPRSTPRPPPTPRPAAGARRRAAGRPAGPVREGARGLRRGRRGGAAAAAGARAAGWS